MAQFIWKLQSGVCRLFVVRKSPSRSVRTGESSGYLLENCTFSDRRVKEDSALDPREVQPVTKSRAIQLQSAKRCRVRKTKNQQEDWTLFYGTSLELNSSHFVVTMATHKATFYLQQKLLPCRMTPWTKAAITFSSPQQLRAFCILWSKRPGFGQRLKCLNLHLDPSTTCKNYSWRGDDSSENPPISYRNRTTYYDILKVSPSATQPQIKMAYYKQSLIYHPDRNPGNEEAMWRFCDINEAYTILGNINLRRKYDRGILSQLDIQNAERPSSKETPSTHTGTPQQQQRARQFSQAGGKPMFDFDAFYQGHYGEQLRRESNKRAMKERMKELQKENLSRWRKRKTIEVTAAMLLAIAGLLYINISKS